MDKNKTFGLGVYVYVFNRDFSKILLLKRSEEKRNRNKADWGNIGGIIEFGENSVDACVREAKEEINIELSKSKLRLLYVKESPHFRENIHALHFVYAVILDENENIKINEESEEAKWFDINNIPEKTLDKKEDILNSLKLAKSLLKYG